jgi:hypothetical protein
MKDHNSRYDDYGTFEELKRVSATIRKGMFDYITGKKTNEEFLRLYYGYEVFLLEHEYVESNEAYFEMDLPEAENFIFDPLHNHNISWKNIK